MPAPTSFDALKGEGSNEPLLGEGGEFILPEGFGANRQWPLPLFADGDWTIPTACGLPEFISPVPGLNLTTGYIFTQKFMQYLANWTPGILNSPHPSAGLIPDYSSWFLVAEGKRRDMNHGVVEWERTYSRLPATHDEYETYSYTFIGYLGSQFQIIAGNPTWNSAVIDPTTGTLTPIAAPFSGATTWNAGRPRFSPPGGVTTRVRHEYFKVGGYSAWSPSTVYLAGDAVTYHATTAIYGCIAAVGPTGTTPDADPTHWQLISTYQYDTAGDIPIINGLLYFNTNYSVLFNGLYAEYLMDALGPLTASIPSRTQYSAWIAKAKSLTWGSDIALNGGQPWTANTGQFPAEDSRVSRWQGNIWLRQTRYILAL